jgi:hypothetical protein
MSDELTTVLRLVAEGKLSADEAAPIIDALGHRNAPRPPEASGTPEPTAGKSRGRRIRIQVTERGRRAVDVRVPLAFAAVAARMVPGIPDSYRALIERAVDDDMVGPIVDLAEDEDGDGVLITIE